MAHYIAELIQAAEAATAQDQPIKSAQCAEAILDIWKHRPQLPSGKRPLGDLEPILRALESLDPADENPRYFRPSRLEANETEQDSETRKWLEFADGLDYSARILIRYCLVRAAEGALDKSMNWVALAEAAGIEDGIDYLVVRILSDEDDLLKLREPDDTARKRLEDRIKRLESFKKMAATLGSDLRRQVKRAGVSKGDP